MLPRPSISTSPTPPQVSQRIRRPRWRQWPGGEPGDVVGQRALEELPRLVAGAGDHRRPGKGQRIQHDEHVVAVRRLS